MLKRREELDSMSLVTVVEYKKTSVKNKAGRVVVIYYCRIEWNRMEWNKIEMKRKTWNATETTHR